MGNRISDKVSGQTECNLTQKKPDIRQIRPFVHRLYMYCIGEEENMSADPEAYAQYYSFYLKYYTQKYSRQTCQLNDNRFFRPYCLICSYRDSTLGK